MEYLVVVASDGVHTSCSSLCFVGLGDLGGLAGFELQCFAWPHVQCAAHQLVGLACPCQSVEHGAVNPTKKNKTYDHCGHETCVLNGTSASH